MPEIHTNTTNTSIKRSYDIHDRMYKFILRVITLTNQLPKTESNKVIIAQLLRCVTSMGANDQEADGTLTKKDFLHIFAIVRKEAKETLFSLQLISDTNPDFTPRMQSLLQEGVELVAIF